MSKAAGKIRPLKDTIGFAHYSWQMDSLMDSLMERMDRKGWKKTSGMPWKLVICPHDDYTYVGTLYPELLQNVKAPNLILIREEIYNLLANKYAIINDSLQKVEHSVEALIPFLQYFNRNISIVPILVPAMNPDRMEVCGNNKAREHESVIIDSCLKGDVATEKIRLFSKYTLNPDNFREYKWTWCGRYSVPVALYASFYLNSENPLSGELIGYSTSITSAHIRVDDIRMGITAIATNCHWVGYAELGYR